MFFKINFYIGKMFCIYIWFVIFFKMSVVIRFWVVINLFEGFMSMINVYSRNIREKSEIIIWVRKVRGFRKEDIYIGC